MEKSGVEKQLIFLIRGTITVKEFSLRRYYEVLTLQLYLLGRLRDFKVKELSERRSLGELSESISKGSGTITFIDDIKK